MNKEDVERMLASFREEERDDEEYYDFLPFSDLHFWVYTGDVLYQGTKVFHARRLAQIRALSFLTYVGDDPYRRLDPEFNHDRFDHTLVVGKVMEEMLTINHFPQARIAVGVTGAVLHDIATPGLGDATKFIDPKNLHEEDHWAEMIDQDGWDFIHAIGSSEEELSAIIKNEGVLGKALDVADRITYVTKDLNALFYQPKLYNYEDTEDEPFLEILRRDPMVGDIYKEVRIDPDTEEVYFTDPRRLKDFLHLRALLNQKLYLHPMSQGRDMMFARLLEPFYTPDALPQEDDRLNPQRLRRMDDSDVIAYLVNKYSIREWYKNRFFHDLTDWHPEHSVKCTTPAEGEEVMAEIAQDSSKILIGMKEAKGFNPATSWKVEGRNGRIQSLREFDPEGAKELEDIAESTKGVFVYYANKSDDNVRIPLLLNANLTRRAA